LLMRNLAYGAMKEWRKRPYGKGSPASNGATEESFG
jgi:hypothetical protein